MKATLLSALLISAVSAARSTTCTGKSANLGPSECAAWVSIFDSTGGARWTHCQDSRLDPCGCRWYTAAIEGIKCNGTSITSM